MAIIDFFGKLTSFVKGSLKVDSKIVFSPTFKFFSDNKTTEQKIIIVADSKNGEKLIEGLNIGALDAKEKETLKRLFNESEKGTLFITEGTDKLLSDVNNTLSDSNSQDLLTFFKDKLLKEDYELLQSALVIRYKYQHGETRDIKLMKQRLVERFGEKAYKITNLVSAGYFEEFLIPLYNEMSQVQGFEVKTFQSTYKRLINEFPLAIFVNSRMKASEIEAKIKEQIQRNKTYGVSDLNIHGIGEDNIISIEGVIGNLIKGKDYISKSSVINDTTIVVRLKLFDEINK